MREIKFKAWHTRQSVMLQVGDDFGTTHPLDCVQYYKEGQPVILLQYTGMKDKNGVELYEGDIYRNWGEVFLCELDTTIYRKLECTLMDGDFEFIGNIYENPELLEGEYK